MRSISRLNVGKTDQIDADSLRSGPKVITITSIKTLDPKEPQNMIVSYVGDNGLAFKPNITLRRVMEILWGDDIDQYTGRSLTLFRDPTITMSGEVTGGVRISHLSHIDRDCTLLVKASRGRKVKYPVKRMDDPTDKPDLPTTEEKQSTFAAAKEAANQGTDALKAWFGAATGLQKAIITGNREGCADEMTGLKAIAAKFDENQASIADPFADDGSSNGEAPATH